MERRDSDHVGSPGPMRRVNLLDLLSIVARHRRMIVRLVSGCFVVAAVLLFLVLPRWYKSTAVVMAPKQKNSLGIIANLARSASQLRTLGLDAGSEDLMDFQAILASRRVMESVVREFNLMEVYDVDTLEKAIRALADNVEFGLGREDVSVEISVYDTKPQRAADMANYFVAQLNQVYLELSVSEAKANRQFLERRYRETVTDLTAAEDSLKRFQNKYGIYSVPDQVRAAVGAAATLESIIALKEVELGMLEKMTTPDNPVRQGMELELRELRKKLRMMKFGGADEKSLVFPPPFSEASNIGIQYVRIYREVEIQNKILELIMPLYEQAKIEEQRNTPALRVLDVATPAVKASRPKRLIILAVVLFVSLLLGFFIALLIDSISRARARRSPEEQAQIEMIKRELHPKNLFR